MIWSLVLAKLLYLVTRSSARILSSRSWTLSMVLSSEQLMLFPQFRFSSLRSLCCFKLRASKTKSTYQRLTWRFFSGLPLRRNSVVTSLRCQRKQSVMTRLSTFSSQIIKRTSTGSCRPNRPRSVLRLCLSLCPVLIRLWHLSQKWLTFLWRPS